MIILNGELAFIRRAQVPRGSIEELNAKAVTPSPRWSRKLKTFLTSKSKYRRRR
jgi:hypothetical protein